MGGHDLAGDVGGEAHHRSDGQVDVAGDDDDRFADGEDRQAGPVEFHAAQVDAAEEPGVADRRDDDQQDQHRQDADLAIAQEVVQPALRLTFVNPCGHSLLCL